MPFAIRCTGCESSFTVAENLIGKTIKCNKCGEMVTVKAPSAAKAAPVRPASKAAVAVVDDDEPVAAKPARRAVLDDDDSIVPAKAARRRDEDDDDLDDRPRKKSDKAAPAGKSKAPLLVGGLLAILLLGCGAVGAYYAFLKDDKKDDTAQNTNPGNSNGTVAAPAAHPIGGPSDNGEKKADAEKKPAEPEKKDDADTKPAEPEKKDETPTNSAPTRPTTTPQVNTTPQTTPTTTTPVLPGGAQAQNDRLMIGQLDDITLAKCKRAAVMIEVTSRDGGVATGSGWFGLEPNLVVTNAHVVDMKAPGSPPPAKIVIFLHSGEHGQTPGLMQRNIEHNRIKIIAVDRENDLAILQIIGEKDLPEPLKVRPTSGLRELQGLTAFGFPRGYTPGTMTGTRKQPTVSSRPSRVTALRYNDYGALSNLQVEGGLNKGNSGGPLVDTEGYVVGVCVKGVMLGAREDVESQIAFCVPTEYVTGLLSGEIMEMEYEQSYLDGDKVKVPVRAVCADPLGRLRRVGVGIWTGDVSKTTRPPGPARKGAQPSDKGFTEVELKYDPAKKEATGELVFPQAAPGLMHWVQPYYTNSIVPKYWLPGITLPVFGPPVERTSTALNLNLRAGTTRPIELTRTHTFAEFHEGDGASKDERQMRMTKVKGTERILDPDRNDTRNVARVRLTYNDIEIKDLGGLELDGDAYPPQVMQGLKRSINQIEAYGYVSRSGEIYKTVTNTLGTNSVLARSLAPQFSTQALNALQVTSIEIPNKTVQPLETWRNAKTVPVTIAYINFAELQGGGQPTRPGGTIPGLRLKELKYVQEITYKYMGMRTRGGKREAVVKITGKAVAAAGQAKDGVTGELKGYAYLDVSNAAVLQADIELEVELDTSEQGFKKRASIIEKYNVVRGGQVN